MPFAATWMQLEIIVLSDVSQEGNDKYHMISRVCRISIGHNCSYHKTEIDSQTQRTDLWLPRGKLAGEETDWEFGISVNSCKLLYTGWINNKFLLYNRGNYIQYPVINHNGKEYEKAYIYIQLHHFAVQ